MPAPHVRFEETPNPDAGKFTLDRVLVSGRRGHTYVDAGAAGGVGFAARLLADPDVVSVFVVADFVTVTKRGGARWKELAPRVMRVLREELP